MADFNGSIVMTEKNRLKPKNLTEQIVYSVVFIAVGNKAYLSALQDNRSDMSIQAKLARKFNKPVIIVLTNELSETDKADLERFFIRYNVIKTLDLDFENETSVKNTHLEIVRLAREIMINRVLSRKDFIRKDLDKDHYYFSFVHDDIEICLEPCAGGFCVAVYNDGLMKLEPEKCTNCDGYLSSLPAMFGERTEETWVKALETANDLYKRYIIDEKDTGKEVVTFII